MNYKFTSRSLDDTLRVAENIESEKFPNMVICKSKAFNVNMKRPHYINNKRNI